MGLEMLTQDLIKLQNGDCLGIRANKGCMSSLWNTGIMKKPLVKLSKGC